MRAVSIRAPTSGNARTAATDTNFHRLEPCCCPRSLQPRQIMDVGQAVFSVLDTRHGVAAAAIAQEISVPAALEGPLQDLCRLGFVERNSAGRWSWRGLNIDTDRRLFALISTFDLRLQVGAIGDGRAWVAAALWEPQDGARGDVFSGAGFRPEDAVRSCLGEFAEFQSWLFRPGDGVTRHEPGRSIDAWSVLGFSAEQRQHWRAFNDAMAGCDDIPSPSAFAGEIDWSEAACLNDGQPSWLPAQLCFGRYAERARRGQNDWSSDSNGCAAGPTREAARLGALLELIERDATGIWWYGKCRRPQLDGADLDHADVRAAIAADRSNGRQLALLDLTHDLGIPVVAAILLDRDGTLRALGVACKATLDEAAASAYLELCQMELSVTLARERVERAPNAMISDDDRRLLNWLGQVDMVRCPHLVPRDCGASGARREALTFGGLVERLMSAGLRTYEVDLTRADIGIPAVRLFAPGLCHFKPRLGHRRLIEVPRALGWREQTASDLNPVPLMI
jgi:ribosomal protein S12 methylthiotransferase accessory factor